ncbi:MAG: carbohydrate ABC transporter permease [Lachnospiraceae bacterium]
MTRLSTKIGTYTFLMVVSLLSIFPMLWMVIAATNKSVDVIAGRLTIGGSLMENYQNLIQNQNIWRFFFNSARYAVLTTILALLVCSMAGYAFEIFHDKAKDILFMLILLTMMLPFVALMVPLFQMFSRTKLLNTIIGFILPSISTPFLIMMFRQSARSFPREIIEAARIEGLNEFQIFFRMFIPTMKSTYAAGATITFMNAWNNYMWPKVIMTKNDAQTMPMMISNLTSGYHTDYGMLMLAVLITTLPTAMIFFVLQKYFAEGITGSVK